MVGRYQWLLSIAFGAAFMSTQAEANPPTSYGGECVMNAMATLPSHCQILQPVRLANAPGGT